MGQKSNSQRFHVRVKGRGKNQIVKGSCAATAASIGHHHDVKGESKWVKSRMQNPGQGSILFPGGIKVYEYVIRQETDIDCGRRRSSSTSTVVVAGINCGRRQSPASPSSAMVGGRGCCRNRQSSSELAPSAAPGIIGFPHIAGYQSIRHAPLWTAFGHCGVRSRSCGGQLSNRGIDRGRSSRGRCARQVSTLPVAQQVEVKTRMVVALAWSSRSGCGRAARSIWV